jgi:hypothetical protein
MIARDPEALIAFLEERQATPFAWGRTANDCVGFALEAVRRQTGRRLLPGVHWTTKRGADRVIRRLGGLEAAVDARLPSIAPAMAQRGDVAAVADDRFGVALVIVEGATLVGPGTRGTRRLPRAAMIKAWSIDV